jgi:surface antigen
MKLGLGRTLFWGVLFVAGLIASSGPVTAGNCALFARAETGVSLYGAAGGWWDEAAGLYQRGHVPEIGSILVFKRTGFMPLGHVAVVSKIVGPGMVLVDHSNWYHGTVTRDTPVIDTSPGHDWSSVAVMNIGSGEFGRDSPAYGFVYPETGARGLVAARETRGFSAYPAVSPAAYEPEASPDLFHFAIDRSGWHAHVRHHKSRRSRFAARYSRRRGHRAFGAGASRRVGSHGHAYVTHHAARGKASRAGRRAA